MAGAPNAVPRHVATPVFPGVTVSVANTNRDGTGTRVTVLTGERHGTLIERLRAKAKVTTTAGMIRFFLDYGGGVVQLYAEIVVGAVTPSASVKSWEGEYRPATPDVIPSGVILSASTHNAEEFAVYAIGGDM